MSFAKAREDICASVGTREVVAGWREILGEAMLKEDVVMRGG